MVKRVNFVYILPPSQKWKKKSWLMLLYKDQQDVSTGGGGGQSVRESLSIFPTATCESAVISIFKMEGKDGFY